MALQKLNHEGYYKATQTFLGNGSVATFTLLTSNFDPLPTEEGQFSIYINNILQAASTYSYNASTGVITFTSAPTSGATISVELNDYDRAYGTYQNIKLDDIINNFIISYVGEDKIISKAKRTDIAFHAQRAVQELNYDTLRTEKAQEIEVPPTLSMILPHDYVNYVKVSWVGDDGSERLIRKTNDTSNPTALLQDSDYKYIFDSNSELTAAEDSETYKKFKANSDQSADGTETGEDIFDNEARYGLNPATATGNGVFFIDNNKGLIYFSSNLTGKIVTLRYISDGVSTSDIKVHKFAEEAVYKYIAHAVLATRSNTPEYLVARFKKERFAEIRKAKLRLTNLKSAELTQIMRGKSKTIKH